MQVGLSFVNRSKTLTQSIKALFFPIPTTGLRKDEFKRRGACEYFDLGRVLSLVQHNFALTLVPPARPRNLWTSESRSKQELQELHELHELQELSALHSLVSGTELLSELDVMASRVYSCQDFAIVPVVETALIGIAVHSKVVLLLCQTI